MTQIAQGVTARLARTSVAIGLLLTACMSEA